MELPRAPLVNKVSIVARKEFYGCSAYKSGCKQTFPGVFLKKKLHPLKSSFFVQKGKQTLSKVSLPIPIINSMEPYTSKW